MIKTKFDLVVHPAELTLKINNDFKMKVDQVVESPPPGVDFDACKEEEEGLCCLGYVSQ